MFDANGVGDMRKENEFGGTYHQMNWHPRDLLTIRDLCLATYNPDSLSSFDYDLLYIADKIEKELGLE